MESVNETALFASRRVKQRNLIRAAQAPRTKPRLLLAVDRELMREGLRLLLGDEFPDLEIVEVSSLGEVGKLLQKQTWDLVVLDNALCAGNGVNVIEETRQKWPRLSVIVVDPSGNDRQAKTMRKAGVSGYLDRHSASTDLMKSVRGLVPQAAR